MTTPLRSLPLILALALVTTACSPRPPAAPVPVLGDEQDLAILAGVWWGEYWSPDTGRSGRIRFRLEPGAASARGDVQMLPARSEEAQDGDRPPRIDPEDGPQTLSISFVRVRPGDETVTGTLDPYRDPDCDCTVTTTFVGRVSREAIAGTFETRGAEGRKPIRGRFRVERTEAAKGS